MTKHHLALGIYQKKLLKKFINYKNETQNHINSNYLSKNPQVYNLWIFYVLKPHFIEKFDQKTTFVRIMFESQSSLLRKTGTFSEQNSKKTLAFKIKFFRKFAPNLLWKISLQKPLLFTRWVAN